MVGDRAVVVSHKAERPSTSQCKDATSSASRSHCDPEPYTACQLRTCPAPAAARSNRGNSLHIIQQSFRYSAAPPISFRSFRYFSALGFSLSTSFCSVSITAAESSASHPQSRASHKPFFSLLSSSFSIFIQPQ